MSEENEFIPSSQARRYVFTINNPFFEGEDIDINSIDLPIKEDYYSKSALLQLEESECFDFHYIKIEVEKEDFEKEEVIIKRPYFKDWDNVEKYFEGLEHRRYCVYQYEQGENGTKHIQGAIFFTIAKRFRTMKDYLPIAHIEKAKGSNSQVREYCTKSETRIKDPVEIGEFAEEKARSDYKDFTELVQSGISKIELSKLYPMLYVRERNKIDDIRADIYEEYFEKYRSVDVTYIYGPSGTGKTTYISRLYSPKEAFDVTNYDNSMFTNYKYQDVLIMDEFYGGLKVQTLNLMLGFKPFDMRGLGCAKPACYHHVFIISNYSLHEIIKKLCGEDYRLYKTIDRRIHKIIHFTALNKYEIERDSEWEDITDKRDLELGLTKQVKTTWEFDSQGNKVILFDRYSGVPELQKVEENVFKFADNSSEENQMLIDENGDLKF